MSIVYKPSSKEVSIQVVEAGTPTTEYPTNITILECPTQVTVGQAFTVKFRLTYIIPHRGEYPLGSAPVNIYVDGAYVLTATTASDGTATVGLTINAAGTHTIKIAFEGMGGGGPITPL
jgi:predicted PilT family ATPase